MSSDLYLGLTTLDAGVFAIFAASFFVLLQTASDVFSPLTPHFLLRRRTVVGAVFCSFLLFAAGTLACVRTAFPDANLIPDDQRTGALITEMWPALTFAGLIVISVIANLIVLVSLISDLRGPGMVSALARQTSEARVNDWLDHVDPPQVQSKIMMIIRRHQGEVEGASTTPHPYGSGEPTYDDEDELAKRLSDLRRRHDQGELSDPLTPLFEVAAHSIEGRRYALVDRSLTAVRQAVHRWLGPSTQSPTSPRRLFSLLTAHLGDLLEVAVHSGSQSQIQAMVRSVEAMALDALQRSDHSYAVLLSEELVHWVRRLEGAYFQPTVSSTIHSIHRIGEAAFKAGDVHVYEQCLLDLARIGEMLGQRYEGQRGLHLLERNVATRREEMPSEALVNTVYWLVELFTDRKQSLHGNVVLVSDALYVCTRSFLEAPGFDERAAEIARSFFENLGDLTLTAAKSRDRDALWKTVYDMGAAADVAQFLSQKILRDSLAWNAFHAGMSAEHNHAQMNSQSGPIIGDDIRDSLADLCIRSGFEELQAAVLGLFDRGHTMYIPRGAQEAFLRRIEGRSGWQFRRYFGAPHNS